MIFFCIEYKSGEETRHARVFEKSFASAKKELIRKDEKAQDIQQVSADYLKKNNCKAQTL